MSEEVVRTTTCDKCHEVIGTTECDNKYVNAGAYGAHFHLSCFIAMSASSLTLALGLDDIKVMKSDHWDTAEKATSYFRWANNE